MSAEQLKAQIVQAEIISQSKDTSLLMQYSCAKCRVPLFTSKGIVPHDPHAEHKQFQKNKHAYSGKGNPCTSVFIDHETCHWVLTEESDKQKAKEQAERKKIKQKQQDNEEEEEDEWTKASYQQYGSSNKSEADDEKDLLCPNPRCKAKLGSKQWQGTQCSCGAWVTPAFKVLVSKIDGIPLQSLQKNLTQQHE
jgi:hypothetical protein